ncbi:hypothetical protein EYZ11_002060 [Aspergillus tanneri]|uniref:Phosphoinositide phospholipase C n=1 Tax=Aspergillus tanneri TaxID=1220188 RepID=A0A4S3JS64_9EURO|nr:uncharacterized protein ATNIH1004_007310 [Aspergillus tanneri]KAA8645889.1 hypothetical protein ATNIH1004_007310 [Aspergillus tanneri]THC98475.1 hypothetical protein EYZ11_002060 [Aspergillus tanneri]
METTNELSELPHHTDRITLNLASGSPVTKSISGFSSTVSSHLDHIYKSLTASSKSNFFEDVQRESYSSESVGQRSADPLASAAAFHTYMASPASSALCPAEKPDLSAPITDYFISSSHNTYLTGNQLYSDAAASSYTNVLLSGCRCVEIDVWDGEPDDYSDDGTSSSSNSSDSSSDEEKVARRKKKAKPEKKRHRHLNSISSKLGSWLGRDSSSEEVPPTIECVSDAAIPVPSSPEPKVLHGHTLTKATTFRHVCNAIRDSAFVVSDLPVIVSLEVHASLEQQRAMVEIMEETWKGMLVEVTPEIEATQALPALEALKRKILIKVKYVIPTSEGEEDAVDDHTDELGLSELQPSQGESSTLATTSNTSDPPPHKPSKILHALSKLAVFTKGFHFSHFTQPEAKVPGHVFSLSENAAQAAHAKERDALFEHNRHHFMRVYPAGLRINSSNLDPTLFWHCGAQIVALNWQSLDKGMMLNHAMFDGEQGWVRKPLGYRGTDASEGKDIIRRQLDLTIEVLAGQDIPLPHGVTNEKGFHPYVSCSLHAEVPSEETGSAQADGDTDSDKASYKRTIKSASGVNPDFGGQKLQFPTISGIIDELTFIRFKVKDDQFGRDPMAAWVCIKVDRLQAGYRLIHLYDCTGSASNGVLLVHIMKDIS